MIAFTRRFSVVALASLVSVSAFAERRQTNTTAKLHLSEGGAIQPLSLGDATQDLLYTTFAQPCRILDTRLGGGAPIGSGAVRHFYAIEAFDGDIASQGGAAGGCNVPTGAAAIMVNFVAVAPAGQGNLKSAAYGHDLPAQGSIINYAQVPGLNIANAVAQPICGAGATDSACTYEFTVQANGAAVHLVADVLGFFMEHRSAFTHTASIGAGNIAGNQTLIDHPLTNGNPSAILLITQNTSLDTHPVGVRYDTTAQKWAIYHPNGAAMPNGVQYNVLVLNP